MFNFIKEILLINRSIHPEVQISGNSKVYLNTIINKILMFIINNLKRGLNLDQNFKEILGAELYKHAILNCNSESGKWINIFVLQTQKINDICNKHNIYLEPNELKFLTCSLEYILAEILELSGNACRDNRKVRLSNDHVNIAIRNDKELADLFSIMDINITAYSKKRKTPKRKRSKK